MGWKNAIIIALYFFSIKKFLLFNSKIIQYLFAFCGFIIEKKENCLHKIYCNFNIVYGNAHKMEQNIIKFILIIFALVIDLFIDLQKFIKTA
jgi:hypothetical protein